MGRLGLLSILALLCLGGCKPPVQYPRPEFAEVYDHRGGDPPVLRVANADALFRAIQVEVTVDPKGRVVSARVVREHSAHDAAAEALIRGRAYRPFTRNDAPVTVRFMDYVKVLPLERLPTRKVAFPAAQGPVKIWLERSGCFGRCPAYRVEITGDGQVTFDGGRFTLVPGRRLSRIPPEKVAALVALFRRADFYSLDPKYSLEATDNPTFTVGIDLGGASKEVIDYLGLEAGMPQAVADLEAAIDEATQARTWTIGNDRTLGALTAEGFDPRSAQAGAMLAAASLTSPEPFVLSLITSGAPLDTFADDPLVNTVWQGAAERDNLPILRALIARSGSWRPPPKILDEALAAAARYGSVDAVRLLIDFQPMKDGPGGREALCQAAERVRLSREPDSVAVADLLLKAGVDPGRKPPFTDRSALFCARTPGMVRLLVAAGARLEARDQKGETLLLSAANEDVALALIDAGADVRAKDPQGRTILDKAREQSWWRVRLALLLRRRL